MSEKRYVVTENQIFKSIKFALELNIQEQRIVDILMHDIKNEIGTQLEFYCEEYKESEYNEQRIDKEKRKSSDCE